MERSRHLKIGILILLLLILIAVILAAVLGYFLYTTRRAQVFNGRPLVLIHNPLNREQILLGDRVFVHATGRAENGIRRIELWVDNSLEAAQDSPAGEPATSMVFSSSWSPTTLGRHILVVRAYSGGNLEGQATITVFAVEGEPLVESHTIEEGETLASIADDYGVSEEELHDLNPEVDPDAVDEGDDVVVPGGGDRPGGPGEGDEESEGGGSPEGDGSPERDDSPEDDGSPPDPFSDDPSGAPDFTDDIGIVDDETHVALKVEVLALESSMTYEALHCFVAIGGGTHRRAPEEGSFATLTGTSWEVASHFSGFSAPVISWPVDQSFEIDMTCVGIQDGGTDSVDLGHLLITVMPIAWDGVTRRAVSPGGEGNFTVDYKVSYALQEAFGEGDKVIDPNMTSPTNVWVNYNGYSLHWSYSVDPEELPINGFVIYMNDNLMWTVPADRRETDLPDEWFRPPCGVDYAFKVSAYRNALPDGPESYSSEPPAVIGGPEPGSPECEREVVVDFVTLTTYDLGGDGDRDPGDVGPIYGTFYANDDTIYFVGSCLSGSICSETSLNHNSEYNINTITTYTSGQSSRLYVHIPEGEALVLEYDISDIDTGRNNRDDPVCSGRTIIQYDVLDEPHESSILAENGRCRVSYTVGLSSSSPVGEAGGRLPLPWLVLEDVTLDPSGTHPILHVRNDGDAAWAGQDLTVEITYLNGDVYGQFTWTDQYIPPGETVALQDPTLIPVPPLDVCVHLDPNDEVLEGPESTEALDHHPICPDLVDLRITGAEYNREYNQLGVTVQNASDIELNNRDVEMFMVLNDGGGLRPAAWPDVSIDPWGATDIVWPVSYITPEIREGMLGGYTLTVDPRNQIAEEEEDNNSFTVAGLKLVQVDWWSYRPPFVMESRRHRSRAHLTIDIQGGVASERILDVWTPELSYTPEYFDNVPIYLPQSGDDYLDYSTGFIEIAGDENIVLNFSAEMEIGIRDIDLGRIGGLLNVGVGNLFRPQPSIQPCSGREEGDGTYTFTVYPRSNYGTLGLAHTPYWSATVNLCSIEE